MTRTTSADLASAVALVDFGSTFTKVAVVDSVDGRLLGTAQSRTTVDSDVLEGLAASMAVLGQDLGQLNFRAVHCCSSAGGGLRIAVLGLESDVTTRAAVQVALNSGGRIGLTCSGPLTADDAAAIQDLNPDLILLVGGTDGGNSECLIANARRIAELGLDSVTVVAGNSLAQEEAGRILEEAGCAWLGAPNVLPEIGEVNAEPAQDAIREVFMTHVIGGKKLSASSSFAAMISMPTPDAVRHGVELLALGTPSLAGLGPILVIDIGGATTDVYSVLRRDTSTSTRREIVPAAQTSRTVEADLGLRWSAEGVVDAAEALGLIDGLGVAALRAAARLRVSDPAFLPVTDRDRADDIELARLAAIVAIHRHAGRQRVGIGPDGVSIRMEGRDLRDVTRVVATGGVFRANPDINFSELLSHAFDSFDNRVLVPREVAVVVDGDYVLAAAGLLTSEHGEAAMRLLAAHFMQSGPERATT